MILTDPIAILAAGRLPQGRYQGALAGLGAVALGSAAVTALLADPALPRPGRLIWGMARSHSQGMNPARTIALGAGLAAETYALTVNMACGSGLGAVIQAAQGLALGGPGAVLAGGSEAMSDTPHLLPGLRLGFGLGHASAPDVMHQDGLLCPVTGLLMAETVEQLVRAHGITRAEADSYALESHRRARAADFSGERLAHPALDRDECIRAWTRLDDLAALPALFPPAGRITAGNASALADGAAAVLLARNGADRAGSGPALARILAWTEVAVAPLAMGWAPVPAVRALLAEAGLAVADVALWELNEAFAGQVLCCARDLGLPLERLNVAGGGISLGHPIAASGARILVTLVHQLRARGGGLGVATLGIGGGLGQAVLIEVETGGSSRI
jgi:acetyl-CoA C-acetyltransferase